MDITPKFPILPAEQEGQIPVPFQAGAPVQQVGGFTAQPAFLTASYIKFDSANSRIIFGGSDNFDLAYLYIDPASATLYLVPATPTNASLQLGTVTDIKVFSSITMSAVSAITSQVLANGFTGTFQLQNKSALLTFEDATNGTVAYLSTGIDTITYASTIALDTINKPNLHKTTTVNATGNATINAAFAGLPGQQLTIIITNDATSGKVITFGTNLKTTGTITGTASKTATIKFISDGVSWFETSRTLAL